MFLLQIFDEKEKILKTKYQPIPVGQNNSLDKTTVAGPYMTNPLIVFGPPKIKNNCVFWLTMSCTYKLAISRPVTKPNCFTRAFRTY